MLPKFCLLADTVSRTVSVPYHRSACILCRPVDGSTVNVVEEQRTLQLQDALVAFKAKPLDFEARFVGSADGIQAASVSSVSRFFLVKCCIISYYVCPVWRPSTHDAHYAVAHFS